MAVGASARRGRCSLWSAVARSVHSGRATATKAITCAVVARGGLEPLAMRVDHSGQSGNCRCQCSTLNGLPQGRTESDLDAIAEALPAATWLWPAASPGARKTAAGSPTGASAFQGKDLRLGRSAASASTRRSARRWRGAAAGPFGQRPAAVTAQIRSHWSCIVAHAKKPGNSGALAP